MKKRMFVMFLFALLLLTVPASADTTALNASAKPYVNLYKKRLRIGSYKKTPLKSFLILDINQNGTPEMICKNAAPDANFCSYMVFTVMNGKLYYCGSYFTKTQRNVLYSKKDKGIYDSWWTNGVGGVGSVTVGISLKKKSLYNIRYAWSGAAAMGSSKMVYQIGPKATKVSKSKFNSYVNTYFPKNMSSRFKTYTFKSNTAANRNTIK